VHVFLGNTTENLKEQEPVVLVLKIVVFDAELDNINVRIPSDSQ